MGDRVAVMKRGRLQQVDTPRCSTTTPSTCSSGGFIGSPAMNLFEAQLRRDADRR